MFERSDSMRLRQNDEQRKKDNEWFEVNELFGRKFIRHSCCCAYLWWRACVHWTIIFPFSLCLFLAPFRSSMLIYIHYECQFFIKPYKTHKIFDWSALELNSNQKNGLVLAYFESDDNLFIAAIFHCSKIEKMPCNVPNKSVLIM